MLPVGLMAPIASSFDIELGVAGLTISVPAIIAALFAPLIIVMAGSIDRRQILAGLLLLLVAANLMAMFAASFSGLFVRGSLSGSVWAAYGRSPAAGPTAAATTITGSGNQPIRRARNGQRNAPVNARLNAAFVGKGGGAGDGHHLQRRRRRFRSGSAAWRADRQPFGWRTAFGAMAAFSVIVLGLNLWTLPPLPVDHAIDPARFQAALRLPLVRPACC